MAVCLQSSVQLLLTKGVSGILEHVRREILSGNTTLDELSYEGLSGSNDDPELFHHIIFVFLSIFVNFIFCVGIYLGCSK
jgi:hypothetical protein